MKAFDCIPYDSFTAKLEAFSFDKKSLAIISAYFKNRKQKNKFESAFSDFLDIVYRFLQGSILGSFLITIFIADLFYVNSNLEYASYADDTTSFVYRLNLVQAISFLALNIQKIFSCFKKS